MSLLPPDLKPRQLRKAKREHAGLRADFKKASWWKLESGHWIVSCSCGWVSPKPVPVYPTETSSFATDLSLNLTMNRHLEETCGRRR